MPGKKYLNAIHNASLIIRESLNMLSEKDLDVVLQEIMTRWDVPGLAVGIMEGDKIVYAKGFGVQSLETQVPVTLDSVFCVQFILPEKNCAAVVLCNEESYAHLRAVRAVADTLLDQKPRANTVSWMVPISRALAEGGIGAAYARYSEIKAREDQFYFGEKESLLKALSIEPDNATAVRLLGMVQ